MSHLPLLPWQAPALDEALDRITSPAAVIHGARAGLLEMALNVARAWLCEAPGQGAAADTPSPSAAAPRLRWQPACGRCVGCQLVAAGTHPDLKVIVPEAVQASLGWDAGDDDKADKSDAKKRKPSAEIKVDAIREAVAFSQHTASRERAKVIVIFPADRLNTVSANTLLKTLEEPPGRVRFLLGAQSLDDVLPTVRSRCQAWRMPPPAPAAVLDWLCTEQPSLPPADAALLLAAAGGQAQDALQLLGQGWTAQAWRRLPADVAAGAPGPWTSWPAAMLIDALQKLSHDLASAQVGGSPRYFPADALGGPLDLARLTAWAAELRQARRQAEHPWNAPLKTEALLLQARRALVAPKGSAAR